MSAYEKGAGLASRGWKSGECRANPDAPGRAAGDVLRGKVEFRNVKTEQGTGKPFDDPSNSTERPKLDDELREAQAREELARQQADQKNQATGADQDRKSDDRSKDPREQSVTL